ncbi:MAG TPA: DUF1800 domain-containing protein [Aggregatilineales bacterium]|nr:DUF1800 domain-containing protein [Aggregatilineales bacterium]
MNRRQFLQLAGLGTGAALVGAEVINVLASGDLPVVLQTPAASDTRDPVWHVLNRITYGPRPGQVDAVKKVGLQAYLDQQFNPQSINDDASEQRIGNYITLDMTGEELYALGNDSKARIVAELDSATVMRAVYSQRDLLEVMTGFWSDHFSIWHLKDDDTFLKTVDDRDVVRKYALGKFRDILGASAHSPAMLIYLDNAESIKSHPNENYARELMELHTTGIGPYTEQDIKEVARCFTGWTIQRPSDSQPYSFTFNAKFHDDAAKTVLGQTIPAGGGIKDGETVLDMLAAHPATAQRIATKLVRRFVADTPPDSLVKAVAQTYTSSSGDIPTMLRTIFASQEFLNAPPKYKRPFEYLVSLARAFSIDLVPYDNSSGKVKGGIPLYLLKNMGQLPFDHITPDGYSDDGSSWISSMLTRWNTAIAVVFGGTPDAKVDLNALVKGQNVEIAPRPILDYFAQHLLGRPLTQTESDTLWGFATKNGEPDLTTDAGRLRMRAAIALMAASPSFQFR